ncbi:hypothetical protein PROFUN_09552 [Planoprotostelium fungivorum]|uniref:Uncharacterized protein n=1 Tax=Planoprotostelium fungivorum TaxID=1890364 RepID=A0A2P6MT22_9EUKA|nr:hypothetical protein PROFUN_09552 [Planoprotostelium fungivorum]
MNNGRRRALDVLSQYYANARSRSRGTLTKASEYFHVRSKNLQGKARQFGYKGGFHFSERYKKEDWDKAAKSPLRYLLPGPTLRRNAAQFNTVSRQIFQRFSRRFRTKSSVAPSSEAVYSSFGLRRKKRERQTVEEDTNLTRQSELSDTQLTSDELSAVSNEPVEDPNVPLIDRIRSIDYEVLSQLIITAGTSFSALVGCGVVFVGSKLIPTMVPTIWYPFGFIFGASIGIPIFKSFTPEGTYHKATRLLRKVDGNFPELMKLIKNQGENNQIVHLREVSEEKLLREFDRIYTNEKKPRMKAFNDLQEIRDIYWTANHYLWQVAEFGPGTPTTVLRYTSAAFVKRNQKILRNLNLTIKLLRSDPQCIETTEDE